MAVDQLGKFSVRRQTLPFQALLPTLEEGPRTAFSPVVSELAELLLEQVGRVQASIGLQQFLQGAPPVQAQVLAPG